MRERYFFKTPGGEAGAVRWWLLLPIWATLAWYFLPVLRADFVADDYVFIATARMVDAPLNAFWQSHFYEPYYFRPLGVLSWWVATRVFGLDYASHSLINLLLHGLNVGLLCWLLRTLRLRTVAVIAGATLFAFAPFTLATVLWPSNRFDLLACGFLLLQAIATVRALQGGALAPLLAMIAALAACWSKELAYPVATLFACAVLFVREVSWQRRFVLFAGMGLAITVAFVVRHVTVSGAYALAGAGLAAQVRDGALTLLASAPRLVALVTGGELASGVAIVLAVASGLALVWSRRDAGEFNGLLGVALLVSAAAIIVQTPLAKPFSAMLDGGAFGTITYARFYYAPWLAICVVIALLVTRARLGVLAMLIATAVSVSAVVAARSLPVAFADWTRNEVRPLSVLATRTVEAGVSAGASADPCVFVLLGAQAKHPYFRMFSDVTVKARTAQPDRVWRCFVMTESTPWLFAFRDGVPLSELPLRPIVNPDGAQKPDSAWGGIRYRYRLPAVDLAGLPGARFFDWRDGEFVEVTEAVRAGQRKLVAKDW